MNINARVAEDKRKHPERFCPALRCLWRTAKLDHATQTYTRGGYCPRHRRLTPEPKNTVLDWIRSGYQFPGKPAPGGAS
jgi:hypothetical protein